MYFLYLYSFKLLHALGLEKSSVRLARHMEMYARHPLDTSALHKAIWEFTLHIPAFPLCQGDFGCYFPILSEDDPFHKPCREALSEEKAYYDRLIAEQAEEYRQLRQYEIDAQHYADLMDSFCTHADPHCFKEADPFTGKCDEHDTFCYNCKSDPCNCAELDAAEEAYYASLNEEYADDYDPPCEGGCGQTDKTCTCAELESWHRHQADPATRGSWWVA